jgi:hypothetical protein
LVLSQRRTRLLCLGRRIKHVRIFWCRIPRRAQDLLTFSDQILELGLGYFYRTFDFDGGTEFFVGKDNEDVC